MTERTAIPGRIRHLGVCTHPQTPYARRACRKAQLAAATPAPVVYRGGEEFDIDGVTVTLCKKGFNGIRWSWWCDEKYIGGEATYATPGQAIADAHATLSGPRCSCGKPATMNASTRKTCIDCYDRCAA